MEIKVKQQEGAGRLNAVELLQGNSKLRLFEYTQEEYDDFCKGFDALSVRDMLESVSTALQVEQPDTELVKIHPPASYKFIPDTPQTKVQILDGYIAISSSNLKALDKFRDRVLKSNNLIYEHRIKTHEGVKIHSYIFNMDKTSD